MGASISGECACSLSDGGGMRVARENSGVRFLKQIHNNLIISMQLVLLSSQLTQICIVQCFINSIVLFHNANLDETDFLIKKIVYGRVSYCVYTFLLQIIIKTMSCMTFSKLLPLFLYIICDSVSIGSQYNNNQ